MLIQCTKKLLDELKIKPEEKTEELPLFSWHANLITINRRKTVVLVNDSNRYIVVLYGLKAKDFKNLDTLIKDAILQTLIDEGIKENIAEQLIDTSPKILYSKTKDRSSVARMNKSCEIVPYNADLLNPNGIIQSKIGKITSTYLMGDIEGNYITPNEQMYKDLEELVNEPIFDGKAVEFRITLDLQNHDVWRKIIIPLNITFVQLHKIIQVAFNWKDVHLHDFFIFDGDEAIVNIIDSYAPLLNPINLPVILDTECKLSEYVPKYSRIKYIYDFGDDWQHYIEIERVIDDYEFNYPLLTGGEGNTPPEDVGGECGYDEFLEVISDTNHPEHDSVQKWAKMQGYEKFNANFVKSRIKNVLNR